LFIKGAMVVVEKIKNSVLIVDDETMNITTLSYILSNDYTVYIEKDGAGCIESAQSIQPDLILLDVVMPGMSGFEVLVALKSNKITKNIPVIFISSLGDIQDEELGLSLGAADYIGKPFSKSIVELRVRNQLRIVNQMRTVDNLSITDALTDTYNRNYFNEVLWQEWKRALRQQTKIGFMIIDLDCFKNYNDTHGYIEGDKVLKTIAKTIEGRIKRAADKLARWNGEEFAIVLPETKHDGVIKVAEHIRESVENEEFILNNKTVTTITVSIGVNTTVPVRDGSYSLNNFISDADNAVIRAKSLGRNTVFDITKIA